MKLKNKKIRKYYQSLVKQEVSKKTDCPDIDILIKSFSDELNENQKFKIIDHISECSTCLGKFDLIEQIFKDSKKVALGKKKISLNENEVKELKELSKRKILELEEQYKMNKNGVKSKQRATVLMFPKIPVKYLSIAAALVIVILGTILIFRAPPDFRNDTLRGKKEKVFQLIAPKGEITKIPLIFKWNPIPDAKEYEVRLMNEELIRIWISDKTPKTYIKLPQDLYQKIEKDTIYYWKVTGYLKDGNIKKSGLMEFELKPN